MKTFTKLALAAASALLIEAGAAMADPADSSKGNDACPTGMVAGPDGVCVKAKSGRMGFDLAAPSDDSAPAASTDAATRGIKTHHHHKSGG